MWRRFSLRAILVAIAILAIFLGRWVHRAKNQRRVVEAVEKAGGNVVYDIDYDIIDVPKTMRVRMAVGSSRELVLRKPVATSSLNPNIVSAFNGKAEGRIFIIAAQSPGVGTMRLKDLDGNVMNVRVTARTRKNSWLENALGTDYFHSVTIVNITRADNLPLIAKLRDLKHLGLDGMSPSDDDMKYAGSLESLRILSLDNTNITDKGLSHLETLKHLEILSLYGTAVTAAGVTKLRQSIPNCEIYWDDRRQN